eukprot:3019531-Pleurochrysis_carterae.AAC.2
MPKINGFTWKEMTKPGFFPAVINALRQIHQRQTPVQPTATPDPESSSAAPPPFANLTSTDPAPRRAVAPSHLPPLRLIPQNLRPPLPLSAQRQSACLTNPKLGSTHRV